MTVQPIVYQYRPMLDVTFRSPGANLGVSAKDVSDIGAVHKSDSPQINNLEFPELNQKGYVGDSFISVTDDSFIHIFDSVITQTVNEQKPVPHDESENYVEVQEGVDFEMLLWNLRERLMTQIQREMSDVFAKLIHQVAQVTDINEGLPRNRSAYIPNSVIAISHLSLPESLVYYELSNNDWSGMPFFVSMFVTKKPSPGQPYIEMTMVMRQYPNREKRWLLRYFVNDLACDIVEDFKTVGRVKFVIRNRKLEEIDGFYKNEKFILDPVWRGEVGEHVDLKEEHVQFGGSRATLVYDRMSEFGVWRDNHGTANQMSMDDIESKAENKNVWITAKKVRFNKFQLNMKFVFGKGILTPVSGIITGSGI